MSWTGKKEPHTGLTPVLLIKMVCQLTVTIMFWRCRSVSMFKDRSSFPPPPPLPLFSPFCVSVCLFLCLCLIRLPISVSVSPSLCLSVCLSVSLCESGSVSSVCLSVSLCECRQCVCVCAGGGGGGGGRTCMCMFVCLCASACGKHARISRAVSMLFMLQRAAVVVMLAHGGDVV